MDRNWDDGMVMNTTQPGSTLLREITLRNLLSFGPDAEPIPLGPVNVLIGPNGSGKSNLIEAIALLRASPGDLRAVIRGGGGVSEWIWKGNPKGAAVMDAVVTNANGKQPLRHILAFSLVAIPSFAVIVHTPLLLTILPMPRTPALKSRATVIQSLRDVRVPRLTSRSD